MKSFKTFLILIVLLGFVVNSCQKPERDNPWDELAKLDPEEWAPQNFQIEDVNITEKKLSWTYDNKNIKGFKLDKKRDDEAWDKDYQIFTKETRSWNDTDITPDPDRNYHYKLSAYAGENSSSEKIIAFNAAVPAPENLIITATSTTSVTLKWNYRLSGHQGFKLERKIDNGSWVMLDDKLNPEQNSFTDDGIDLNNHYYNYRINAFLAQYSSLKIDFPHPFLCGITNIIDNRDSNQYETIQIGNQCWMKENLKWLPSVSPSASSSTTSTYYYVYSYQGTSVLTAKATANYQTYGVLYNWPAALNACPNGWHLPTDNEWTVLIDYLGGGSVAGGKMKTTGTTHWNSPNNNATNSSGFTGLPAGQRFNNDFGGLNFTGHWWSSTEYSSTHVSIRQLDYLDAEAWKSFYEKEFGISVRCIRD